MRTTAQGFFFFLSPSEDIKSKKRKGWGTCYGIYLYGRFSYEFPSRPGKRETSMDFMNHGIHKVKLSQLRQRSPALLDLED